MEGSAERPSIDNLPDSAELDMLVREIFEIIPSDYDDDRQLQVKRAINEYVIRKRREQIQ
jgi:hypothetical protein